MRFPLFRTLQSLAILAAIFLLFWIERRYEDVENRLASRRFSFETSFFGMRYAGTSENYLDRKILIFGAFERPLLYFFRDTATALNLKDPVVFDIGANTGQHSLYFSTFSSEVHAFEPYEPVLARLRHNLELNNIKNVIVHPVGLGSRHENLPFVEPSFDNLGNGSFLTEGNSNMAKRLELEIVRGDDYLELHPVRRVDLIKLDIEGYEKEALLGLRKTLEQFRPIVIFEYGVKMISGFQSEQAVRDVFPSAYKFLQMKNGDDTASTYEVTAADLEVHHASENSAREVIAVPEERAAQIPRKNLEQFAK